MHWGRKVLEVRPPGDALTRVSGSRGCLPATPVTAAVYVGDDRTDLDAFRGLRELARSATLAAVLCVAVSSEEAPEELALEADLTVDGTAGVRGLLEALL